MPRPARYGAIHSLLQSLRMVATSIAILWRMPIFRVTRSRMFHRRFEPERRWNEVFEYGSTEVRSRLRFVCVEALEPSCTVGKWPSCLNVRWDDPRDDDERHLSKYLHDMRAFEDSPTHFLGTEGDWKSPLMRLDWNEDTRLKTFEDAFWRAVRLPL